jgi:pimeloyl-ACP methyl ester carboxylesterase
MTPMHRLLFAAVVTTSLISVVVAQTPPSAKLDAAMRAFWDADGEGDAASAAKQIVASGASVEEIRARLRTGRPYAKQKTGRIELPSRDHGLALDNIVEVPADYDPARAWPLRVSMHGGVGREAPGPNDPPARPLANRIQSAGEIVLHPRAWAQSQWWHWGQVENISRLVARVKRDYNVDESRIYITGISDGGSGVYFLAMRDATPWSACMPLNGHPLVIANPDTGADGQLYVGNLVNCPLHIVNGGKDPLYPAASVEPLVAMFKRAGVTYEFKVYPDAGHDVSWWPQERAGYEAYLASHPRQAHPPRISWETERTDRYNRFRWLVIDRLGKRPSDVPLPDVNTYQPIPLMERQLFAHEKPSGRVDVVRAGNAIEAKTRGVQAFTLLLSPDAIDFTKPVRVTVNGKVAHDAVVKPDAATMLTWAARDRDRTMLYGAQLQILVP